MFTSHINIAITTLPNTHDTLQQLLIRNSYVIFSLCQYSRINFKRDASFLSRSTQISQYGLQTPEFVDKNKRRMWPVCARIVPFSSIKRWRNATIISPLSGEKRRVSINIVVSLALSKINVSAANMCHDDAVFDSNWCLKSARYHGIGFFRRTTLWRRLTVCR